MILTSDALVFMGALVCIPIRLAQLAFKRKWPTTQDFVSPIFNGSAVVPFFMMGVSVFNPTGILSVPPSPLTLSIAGSVGLFYILGEIVRPASIYAVANHHSEAKIPPGIEPQE